MDINSLYISDLDGALLNAKAELSPYAAAELNKMIASGLCFSVATARTPATAFHILREVALDQPLIMMNGVLIYDMATQKFVRKEIISPKACTQIVAAMRESTQSGFMYGLAGEELLTFYENLDVPAQRAFVRERVERYGKEFTRVDDFATVGCDIIYFCFLNTEENIEAIYHRLTGIAGIRYEKYRDIYTPDMWYLEVFGAAASKYEAVVFLREKYHYQRVIGFGDNLNDLPLFAACDEAYAVANAREAVKQRATAVIGANSEDGVVKFLVNYRSSLK